MVFPQQQEEEKKDRELLNMRISPRALESENFRRSIKNDRFESCCRGRLSVIQPWPVLSSSPKWPLYPPR